MSIFDQSYSPPSINTEPEQYILKPGVLNMPVITTPVSHSPFSEVHKHAKRSDWAQSQPGVILVFVIVFTVGCAIFAIIVHREWKARRAERAEWTVEEIKDDA